MLLLDFALKNENVVYKKDNNNSHL